MASFAARLVLLAAGLISACDTPDELSQCSSVCEDIERRMLRACGEPDPAACRAEIDDAAARCKADCVKQTR